MGHSKAGMGASFLPRQQDVEEDVEEQGQEGHICLLYTSMT